MATLSFEQFIGGDDDAIVEQVFPSTQRTVVYDFAKNINTWTFLIDYQTVIVDKLAFDRNTGQPNFSTSTVLGTYGTRGIASTATYVNVVNATSGTVAITLPGNIYTGEIIPNARQKVPITVVSVQWTDAQTPPQTDIHRWALIQSWEAGVTPDDPTTSTNFIAL